MDGQIWALKADSLTSPLIVTVTVTVTEYRIDFVPVLYLIYDIDIHQHFYQKCKHFSIFYAGLFMLKSEFKILLNY